jgi:hypothetical protein
MDDWVVSASFMILTWAPGIGFADLRSTIRPCSADVCAWRAGGGMKETIAGRRSGKKAILVASRWITCC